MADEYALSHKTSGTGTRDNETRHNPSAKSYQSKGLMIGGEILMLPTKGHLLIPSLTARVIIPPGGGVMGIMAAGGIGVAQVM